MCVIHSHRFRNSALVADASNVPIIENGELTSYASYAGSMVLPSDIRDLKMRWWSPSNVGYIIDVTSGNTALMDDPTLSIATQGDVPSVCVSLLPLSSIHCPLFT